MFYGLNIAGTTTATTANFPVAALLRHVRTYTSATANATPMTSLITLTNGPVVSNTATSGTTTVGTVESLYHNPTLSLNDKGEAAGTVMVLGEQRTYYLRVPYISSNYFAPSPLAVWCNTLISQDQLAEKLLASGVKYIFINERELARLGGFSQFGFNQQGSTNLQNYLRTNAKPAFSSDGTTIFQLL
jgi:hypothetical protein